MCGQNVHQPGWQKQIAERTTDKELYKLSQSETETYHRVSARRLEVNAADLKPPSFWVSKNIYSYSTGIIFLVSNIFFMLLSLF